MTAAARKDQDNLRILETLKPEFERLKATRIRTEAEVDRHAREHDQAKLEARERLGTDEETKIRQLIEEGRARNTQMVDEFVAAIEDVKARLAEIDGGAA